MGTVQPTDVDAVHPGDGSLRDLQHGPAEVQGEHAVLGKCGDGGPEDVRRRSEGVRLRHWSYPTKHPVVSSALTTAGGIVFIGEATGEFDALDARTGRLLWQFQTGSGIHGSAVSYCVNGKQYVAVRSGWGGWLEGFAPELYGESRGNALVVFALP